MTDHPCAFAWESVFLLAVTLAMIITGLVVVPIARRVRPSILVPAALVFSAVGYAGVALGGATLDAGGIALSFLALAIGIGASETVSNELIVSNAPAEKMGAASAVSETAYELGAVLGTTILGTILSAGYRSSLVLPESLTTVQRGAAEGTLGGAVWVAEELPPGVADDLLTSALDAFDTGIGPTAWIGMALVVAAAVVAALSLRKAR